MTEVQVNITEEMKSSFIDYAMSVIVRRALPDVRDGLKPVHRRILFAMYEQGLTHDQPYKKSARVVGDVMGNQTRLNQVEKMIRTAMLRHAAQTQGDVKHEMAHPTGRFWNCIGQVRKISSGGSNILKIA